MSADREQQRGDERPDHGTEASHDRWKRWRAPLVRLDTENLISASRGADRSPLADAIAKQTQITPHFSSSVSDQRTLMPAIPYPAITHSPARRLRSASASRTVYIVSTSPRRCLSDQPSVFGPAKEHHAR